MVTYAEAAAAFVCSPAIFSAAMKVKLKCSKIRDAVVAIETLSLRHRISSAIK